MKICPGCKAVRDDSEETCPNDGLPLIDHSRTFTSSSGNQLPPQEENTKISSGLNIGDYRVTGIIAEGGMGTIYDAVHPVIRKRVAIKVLNSQFARDPRAVSRFVLEARAVNEVGHHNIVDIFSIGALDDHRTYLVMEYLEGLSLDGLLHRTQRLEPAEALAIYEQLCDALDAAHGKGFIHRDLKPENILLLQRPPRPFVKVLDFGLAKLRGSAGQENTEIGMVVGTPEYMAPEQCRGWPVDARTDVYALGIVLYELLTGQRPFAHTSPYRVLTMQTGDAPRPPSQLAPVPAALERVVLRAMDKEPQRRYQSCGELLRAIQRVVPQRVPWTIDLSPLEHYPPARSSAAPAEGAGEGPQVVPQSLSAPVHSQFSPAPALGELDPNEVADLERSGVTGESPPPPGRTQVRWPPTPQAGEARASAAPQPPTDADAEQTPREGDTGLEFSVDDDELEFSVDDD